MGARRSDRLWLAGGLLAIVAMVAASWFLVISPKFAEVDEVRAETDAAQLQLIKLNKEVAALAAQAKQEKNYKARLRASQAALPSSYHVPAFLRQLQDSGSAVNVQVSGFAVGSPAKSTAVPGAAELPITLNASGTATNLSLFFDRLQNVQSRAVLVSAIGLEAGDADSGGLLASITLKAFCLQPTKTTAENNCKAV
jgi:type IV pilus assembly protein PilO